MPTCSTCQAGHLPAAQLCPMGKSSQVGNLMPLRALGHLAASPRMAEWVPASANQAGPPALWTYLLFLLLLCQLLLNELLGPLHVQLHVSLWCTALCRMQHLLLTTAGREHPALAPGSAAGHGALCCQSRWPQGFMPPAPPSRGPRAPTAVAAPHDWGSFAMSSPSCFLVPLAHLPGPAPS